VKTYLVDGTITYHQSGEKRSHVNTFQTVVMAENEPHAESVALRLASKKYGNAWVDWYTRLPRVTPYELRK
jgi:hypothetical protein